MSQLHLNDRARLALKKAKSWPCLHGRARRALKRQSHSLAYLAKLNWPRKGHVLALPIWQARLALKRSSPNLA